MGLHLIKSFCMSKETVNRVKRQSMEWKKIIANHISDKGLIHRLQKELLQLNNNDNKTPNNLIKNDFHFLILTGIIDFHSPTWHACARANSNPAEG